jgi:hypothetical protein
MTFRNNSDIAAVCTVLCLYYLLILSLTENLVHCMLYCGIKINVGEGREE